MIKLLLGLCGGGSLEINVDWILISKRRNKFKKVPPNEVFSIKSSVIRDNLLVSSKAHEWRRTLDELQGNNTITTRQEAMSGMQASAISGAATGILLACALCKLQKCLISWFLIAM